MKQPSLLVLATVIAAVLSLPLIGCNESSSAGSLESSLAETRIRVTPISVVRPPVFTLVRQGDTLESVSRRLAGDEWVAWRDALATEIDPRRLQPGTTFDGLCSRGGRLQELRVSLDLRTELRLEQSADGISTDRLERPIEIQTFRITGSVESSLFGAVEKAGGRPELAVRLAEIFQWDIDFLRDLRQGDAFTAVADLLTVDGEFYGYGTVYAVSFSNRGKELVGVAYCDGNGRLGYFDREGRTMRKQFLRSPLKFSRITSRFSMRRYHPVHKRSMPHYGVDYGAPVGTPVLATADGTVSKAGRNGGAGRMVSIRHTNGFETNYLHLRGYGPGIRRGVRVRQGQVVGYVGSSGVSTGPHLDYRVTLNGRWINPLTISSPPVQPLDDETRERFLAHAAEVLQLLDRPEVPDAEPFRTRLAELSKVSAGETSL